MSQNQFYFQSGYILTIGKLLFPEAPISMNTHYPSQTKRQELLFEKNIVLVGNPNITEYHIVIKIPHMEQWNSNMPKIYVGKGIPDYNYLSSYQTIFEYTHPALFYLKELEHYKLEGIPVFFCLQRTKPNRILLDATYDTVIIDEVQIEESGALGRDRKLEITLVRYATAKNQPIVIRDKNIQNTEEVQRVSTFLSQQPVESRREVSLDVNQSPTQNQYVPVTIQSTSSEVQNALETITKTNIDPTTIVSSRLKKFIQNPRQYPAPPYVVQTKVVSKIKNVVRGWFF